jgi:transketolase C-terminal domain/subunit
VVLKSKDDQVTVIGAGVTLHEALAAAEMLKKGEEKRFQKDRAPQT